MKNSLKQLLLLVSLTATVHAQTAIIDFNTNDAGGAITAGDGSNDNTEVTPTIAGYDFNNLQPYANIYGNNQGVTFSAVYQNGDVAPLTVYNTNFGGADLSVEGSDDDLEPGYEGGNNTTIVGGVDTTPINFGNALIIQEIGVNIDTPDDEGSGGILTIASDLALSTIAFDILDVDNPVNATFTFTSSTNVEVMVGLALFQSDSGTIFAQNGVEFGDRHSNNIVVSVSDLEEFNTGDEEFTDIVEIEFNATTSGALAEIELTVDPNAIPEPSSTLLAGLGMLTLAFRRKR